MTRTPLHQRIELGALAPYWHRTRDWWNDLSPRERVLLTILGALGAVALVILIALPLREARQDALDTIRNADLIEARLRSGGAVTGAGPMRTGTPSAIVANSIAAAQLQVGQVAAEGNGVRVTVSDAPFDGVMLWIADVEATSSLRVRSADIQRQGAPGIVTATFVLTP
ncbi:MAG: type II secretion system protein GspM [Pontixanthobacter sp.]